MGGIALWLQCNKTFKGSHTMRRHITARTNNPTVILMSRSLHLLILGQTHHTQPLINSVRFPPMIDLRKKVKCHAECLCLHENVHAHGRHRYPLRYRGKPLTFAANSIIHPDDNNQSRAEMSHTPGGARARRQTVRKAAAAHVRAQAHTHI